MSARIFRTLLWLPVFVFLSCALNKQLCPADYTVRFSDALEFADKADLAYQSNDSVMASCEKKSCFVLDGALTQARAVVEVDDSARIQWIAFRGTATVSDAQLDADYTQKPDSVLGIYLHSGFAAAANDLLPKILPLLKPGYKTNVSGHSLGGAIAVVTALYLRKRGYIPEVYTFGQPKVTNLEGAAVEADSLVLTRFVDDKDIVALMPPLDWKPGGELGSYAHFGREVHLQGEGYECLQRHYMEIDLDVWKTEFQKHAAMDHSLALYRAKIANLKAATAPK